MLLLLYRLKMQKTHAAVFRTGDVMREGIEKMNALWKDMANLKVSDKGMIWNRLVAGLKVCGLVKLFPSQ